MKMIKFKIKKRKTLLTVNVFREIENHLWQNNTNSKFRILKPTRI